MRNRFALVMLFLACSAIGGGVPWSRYNLIDSPTAHMLNHTEISAGVSFAPFSLEDSSGSSSTEFSFGTFVEVGILSRGQVGATFISEGGISGTARVLLMRETIKTPGIAFGCENITGEENYEAYTRNDSLYDYGRSQNFSIYGVITKDFSYYLSLPVCASLGFGTGRFVQQDGTGDAGENPLPGLFGSLMFHPSRASEVVVEWDGRDFNIGGTYGVSSSVFLQLAFAEVEQHFRSEDIRDPADPGQAPKVALSVNVTLGPLFRRTELNPYQRLRFTENDEALEAIRREREEARRRIEELERSIR